MSKDKSKKKNSKSKNKTEKQGKKIKSIYKINVPPNNLSKTKYSTINKKPTTSIFLKKNIKNQTDGESFPFNSAKGLLKMNNSKIQNDVNNFDNVNQEYSLNKINEERNK